MKKLLVWLLCWPLTVGAQVGTYPALIGQTGTSNPATCQVGRLLFRTDVSAGLNIYGCTSTNTWTQLTAGAAAGLTVGTSTITSGTSGRVLYDNAGVLGEMTTTGSGTVLALATGASLTTPTISSPTITGTAVTFTSGTSRTIANASEIVVCTSTCTITVPGSATAGMQFCVQNDDNVSTVITLAAVSGVQFENTARTSYKAANTALVSSGAVGNQICMVAISATKWNVFSYTGTWS